MNTSADYITQIPKDEQNRKGKIRTYTGRYVNPLNLTPDDIEFDDIAHALSLECRYTGHCPWHYSVGLHSLLVSEEFTSGRFDDPQLAAAGLLHDAAEAYLKDIPSPVKHDPRFAFYREAEEQATRAIFSKFRIPYILLGCVKPVDDMVFHREAAAFWGSGSRAGLIQNPATVEYMFRARAYGLGLI